MAKVILEHPIAEIHGSLSKHGDIINRQKKFRDDSGRVIHEGKQEAYVITRPRNFKTSPAKGAELANQLCWREACHRAAQILQAAQLEGPTEQQLFERKLNQVPEYYTLEEARVLVEDYRQRYQAQLTNTRGKHPDPKAPIDPKTGKGKQYAQFPAFIRAMIYHALKLQQAD